jgi:hypothetical protein
LWFCPFLFHGEGFRRPNSWSRVILDCWTTMASVSAPKHFRRENHCREQFWGVDAAVFIYSRLKNPATGKNPARERPFNRPECRTMTYSGDLEKRDKGRDRQKKIFHQSNEILVSSSVLNIIDQLSYFFSEGLHLSPSDAPSVGSSHPGTGLPNCTTIPRTSLTQECTVHDCPSDFDKNRNRLFGGRSPFARRAVHPRA